MILSTCDLNVLCLGNTIIEVQLCLYMKGLLTLRSYLSQIDYSLFASNRTKMDLYLIPVGAKIIGALIPLFSLSFTLSPYPWPIFGPDSLVDA